MRHKRTPTIDTQNDVYNAVVNLSDDARIDLRKLDLVNTGDLPADLSIAVEAAHRNTLLRIAWAEAEKARKDASRQVARRDRYRRALLSQPPKQETRHQTQAMRCRSALGLACSLLPHDVRHDALEEWMDELHCAAQVNRPVLRRTVSIIVRAIPRLIWEARRPARARIKGD